MTETLAEVWRRTVQQNAEAPAVVVAGTEVTWSRSRLAAAVDAWCAGVPDSSALHRRRVAFTEPNGTGWWTAFLGLLQLGAIPVPLDVGEPAERQAEMARRASAVRLWAGGAWVALGRARPRPADECLVKLTSGSSGRPRAWAFTHGQMLADGRQVCAGMGIRPQDMQLAAIPLGHSYGLGNLVLPLILQGTAMVLVDPPLPNVLATAIERWGCSAFPAVPALLDALARSAAPASQLRSLRLVVSAGARLAPAWATAFQERFGCRVHNFYGTSETGGICYDRTGEATLAGGSVGSPLPGVRLRWRSRRRFVVESAAVRGNGAFSPADLGVLNEAGELTLLGRAGRLVKLGARRVDLGEVEAALRSIPGVQDAFAALDEQGRPALVAAVATALPKEQLRSALVRRLARWKQPQRLVVLAALPQTARGKIDRAALQRMLTEERGARE